MRKPRRWDKGAGWAARRRLYGLLALMGLAVLALALVGCPAKTGTYAPVDWAYEMHYSPSYRPQEPPRQTSPDGAVPYKSGREIVYTDAEYAGMPSPISRTQETLAQGQELFRVNCSFCHGPMGEGGGKVGVRLGAPPLTGEPTKSRPAGEIFRIVSQGGNAKTLAGMPRFSLLLSVEDRWLLVDYVMSLQGR